MKPIVLLDLVLTTAMFGLLLRNKVFILPLRCPECPQQKEGNHFNQLKLIVLPDLNPTPMFRLLRSNIMLIFPSGRRQQQQEDIVAVLPQVNVTPMSQLQDVAVANQRRWS